MLVCAICGESYWPHGCSRLDVCTGCAPNLAALSASLLVPEALAVDPDMAQRLLADHAAERQAYAVRHSRIWSIIGGPPQERPVPGPDAGPSP